MRRDVWARIGRFFWGHKWKLTYFHNFSYLCEFTCEYCGLVRGGGEL